MARQPRTARKVSAGRVYEWRSATAPLDDKAEIFWSVTTIIKNALPAPNLQKWGMRRVAEEACANYRRLYSMLSDSYRFERNAEGRYVGVIEDPDAVAKAVAWLMESPYAERDRKADIGSAVHEEAEAFALDKPMPPPPERIEPYLASFHAFLADWSPTFVQTDAGLWMAEASVFNRTELYAGTLDAIVDLPGRGRVLIDYKTGKGVYHETALQLSAYRYAEFIGLPGGEEWPMPEVDGCAVLHLTEDGYELIPVVVNDVTFNAFKYAREIFRWMEETSKGVIGQPISPPKRVEVAAA